MHIDSIGTAEHLAWLSKWERAKLLHSHKRHSPAEPSFLARFHQLIVCDEQGALRGVGRAT